MRGERPTTCTDRTTAACNVKLRSGRLNDRALFLLIQDAAPATGGKYNHSRVGIPAIKAVLEGIDSLDKNFLRKLVK